MQRCVIGIVKLGPVNTGAEHIPTDINEVSQIYLHTDALPAIDQRSRWSWEVDEFVLPAQLIIKSGIKVSVNKTLLAPRWASEGRVTAIDC